ncbi:MULTISPECIES: phosphoribosylformylglycinamidine synthase subunit PurQ [unclassified Cyanobium]|uniref:phosphoribosylformylglycinamidine synthase subunit PurQ n=1 Tax=unclassified Cyanobium TaxID=2627006 RepID=UPI0020CC983F|nr:MULTISPECIES: phosphoribosylformylglycinamidine synthase subunit PurQ [unclassified Cyanobium]MCP9858261.1 phosphoribosylformylglycinamidine synthase subunit PurQ [Cyanobium sp. Cruz-8H5]MCP9865642.1 phosphoribosylformylglycinamidine synthase subunit PurQ [Cyanobium sp. Cruz-8D1]
MTVGIVVFPGSNCDRDVAWALEGCLGIPVRFLWHEERDLSGLDAVVLPGGFSYGDYLRCGAIARFAPVLEEVRTFAERGGPVLGICNGFQVLTEMGLLPGALTRNRDLHFLCQSSELEVRPGACRWLAAYGADERISLPIAHGEGRYQVEPQELQRLEDQGCVVLRYVANPNGSRGDVAGLTDPTGRVLGLMPHPERACDPITGGLDGRRLLASLLG